MQLVATAGLVPTSARCLPPLKLYQPRSIGEALDALAHADMPVILAGGTDLVAAFNDGLQPRELVSLADVAELQTLEDSAPSVRIGAMVTHHAGCTSEALLRRAPGFAQAWSRIANPRIRCTGTLAGNLMARRVRYEGSVLLSAANATLVFASRDGPLHLNAPDWWRGRVPQRSLLAHVELQTADLAAFFYERSMRPLITFATALRRRADGLVLSCAVATEYLQPVLLELALPGADLARVARDARGIAVDTFAQLPETFTDPALTPTYARAAGTALLARRLAGVLQ
jgi:aerobic carbon-monoxide dehydrogenase medium subunit